MLNILHFGADNTGQQDSSAAVQNACNAATPSGLMVFVPAGQYLIRERISVPAGVTLIGENSCVPRPSKYYGNRYPLPVSGFSSTFILATPANWAGSFVLNDTAAMENLSLYQSGHTYDVAPSFRIPAVFINAGANGLDNIEFVNVWHAVKFVGGNGFFRNLYGHPVYGIEIDGAGDVPYFENVQFGTKFFAPSGNYYNVCRQSGIGLISRLADAVMLTNCTFDNYLKGMVFAHSITSPGNKGTNGMISNCAIKECAFGIDVDSHSWDLRFTNCQIQSSGGNVLLRVNTSGSHPVMFSVCDFIANGPDQRYIVLNAGKLRVHECSFEGNNTNKQLEFNGGILQSWSTT